MIVGIVLMLLGLILLNILLKLSRNFNAIFVITLIIIHILLTVGLVMTLEEFRL